MTYIQRIVVKNNSDTVMVNVIDIESIISANILSSNRLNSVYEYHQDLVWVMD
jgi:hypothetical protein